MTIRIDDCDKAAREIINLVGNQVVIGVPLGLGKPIGILNALYRLALADSSISLTIITGLTLSRPTLKNELEKQFISPILDRLLGDYEDPLYEKPREQQRLPANINVIEFFLFPGKFLHNTYAQRNYISSSYTNVVRDAVNLKMNVYAQQVSSYEKVNKQYSLSCNTDLFHDVLEQLSNAELSGQKTAIVAEVNANLPYMYGDVAEISSDVFSIVADTRHYRSLFAVPRDEISVSDHLIGLYSSSLIKDDGCLQIGIGKLSNALANALIFRHNNNDLYRALLAKLEYAKNITIPDEPASLGSFETGLYASTEMLSDEYLQLYNQGILKKKVYDHAGLQKLLNEKVIAENVTPEMIDILIDNKIIHSLLTPEDLAFLIKFGIFKSGITLVKTTLQLPDDEFISADLNDKETRVKMIEKCLGSTLKSGKLIHAGFFFGSVDLYSQLRKMSLTELRQIEMSAIARTNALLWSPELLMQQRKNGRFVNSCLVVTLLGGVISDGLANYQELSGVGGQYDFVSMADELPDGRSIINCRSTRQTKHGVESNIVWDFTNATLPRYLRDVIVTEYGVAECRSKTDEEVIKAMLNIADSRFQAGLLAAAKKAGKIALDYQIPVAWRNNYPEKLDEALQDLRQQGFFKSYPFGSDLTPVEERLARALQYLKYQSSVKLIFLAITALFSFRSTTDTEVYLQRMNLNHPDNIKSYIYKKLITWVLANVD